MCGHPKAGSAHNDVTGPAQPRGQLSGDRDHKALAPQGFCAGGGMMVGRRHSLQDTIALGDVWGGGLVPGQRPRPVICLGSPGRP